ncbi:unnamed protein product [Rotaria sp. Silwood1]|nr:unnamed protein product [Rotaria sp. Silwood1]CAF1676877.1 unnamed protein product [Rotaria sp. Silwood1]
MSIEKDPYSLIKYINVINMNNDGYGYPTIHAFVLMGLLKMNEKFLCNINNRLYECYIDKNEKNQYVLCYQNKIKETKIIKFIHKLFKLIKIKIRSMGVPFQYIHRVSDNRTLLMLYNDLKEKFQERIIKMLINSEFDIWEIHTDYDFDNKKIKFICKSNMTINDILQIINNNNNMSHNDINDNIFKEKQQLYSLIKHDAIEINYQPITDDDKFILESGGGNDTSYSSDMYKDEGSISFFFNFNKLDFFFLYYTHIFRK